MGQTALIGLESRGPPAESPMNAASLSFCDVFTLTRKAAIGLLDTLPTELRREWLCVTLRHAEGIIRDEEEGVESIEEGGLEEPAAIILAKKIGELKRREVEVAALRDEVLALMMAKHNNH